jgi:repressor LexA
MLKSMDFLNQSVLHNLSNRFYAYDMKSANQIPRWAHAVRSWREKLYESQARMEAATGDVLSQIKISRVERGKTHPTDDLNTAELNALLDAFSWSPIDFSRETGLSFPSTEAMVISKKTDRVIPVGYHLVEILGVAAAGFPHTYPVPNRLKRPGARVFQVEGNSMNGGTRPIFDGDHVLVDTNIKNLQEGKVFVLEILGDGYTVKRSRKIRDSWVLMSDNPDYETYVPEEARIIGQVYRRLADDEV